MDKFTTLTGVAAPLPIINIDTDMIIPKQYLKTIKRTGLGTALFSEMRYNEDGSENADFVLNKPSYRQAKIVVAGDNFGCGSSREHAPWALLDCGTRCVISTSFADIFYNNCFKNGMLPVVLSNAEIDEIFNFINKENGNKIQVDLPSQKVTLSNGKSFSFEVDSVRKECLLNGWDDIGLTLRFVKEIDQFEVKQKSMQPWLYAI